MPIDPVRLELEVAHAAVQSGRTVRSSFRVRGWSMLPAVEPGARVTVESSAPEALRPGELVCWCREMPGPLGEAARRAHGSLAPVSTGLHKVVHRLVRTMKDDQGRVVVITRGDANGVDDRPVPAERVVGRVVRVEKPPMRFRLRRLAARMKATLAGALGSGRSARRATGRSLRCAR